MSSSKKAFQPADKSINLVDIFWYLLFHWKWFFLSVLVFGGYYYYQYSKTPYVYSRTETVMIKTPLNTAQPTRLTRSSYYFSAVNVASEILQLKSKQLMRNTVAKLDANISYTITKGLREYELYNRSPIQIQFIDGNPEKYETFKVANLSEEFVELKGFGGDENDTKTVKVTYNKETSTPAGKIRVLKTTFFDHDNAKHELTIKKYPLESMMRYFMGKLNIKQMEDDASLLQVSIEDTSPDRAEEVISELIEVYNQETKEDRSQVAINTAEFIQDRITIIESELGSVESDIESLRVSNQGMDINRASEIFVTESRQFQAEANDIQTQLSLVEMMKDYLQNAENEYELIPNNTGLVDVNIENQINDYNKALLNRNRLLEGSSSSNPVVQEHNKSLNSLRQNINRAVDNAISGLRIKMENIRKEETTARNRAISVPSKQRVMLSVERQQKVKEELYLLLLNKREENAINLAMTEDNVRVIDPASGPSRPIYPGKIRKVALGVGIGLVLPAIILLIILMLDTSIRDRKDLEDRLSVPFLGEIPKMKGHKSGESEVVVSEKGRDMLSESFRIVRTNIGFMAAGKNARVITFTSFNAAAGKTFTAINLAASYSYLAKKSVLLDLDLRKGTLSNRLEIPKGLGATNFLANPQVGVDEIIYKGYLEEIDVVPIGDIAPNPVELLLGERLDELIAELKERYDYIIIDNVPMNMVADATVIDRVSELSIFVIRSGKMDRRMLPEVQDIYDEKKLNNMAVLLNGVDIAKKGYYGYGGYGYGYGYAEEKKGFFKRLFS